MIVGAMFMIDSKNSVINHILSSAFLTKCLVRKKMFHKGEHSKYGSGLIATISTQIDKCLYLYI